MKDRVTFETAKALQEAGFPQPEPEFGQVWWIMWNIWQPGFVGFVDSRAWGSGLIHISIASEPAKTYGLLQFENFVYAPVATDIMKTLACYDLGFYDTGEERTWIVFGLEMEEIALNDNPAEAAAAAWLEIHRKKDLQV